MQTGYYSTQVISKLQEIVDNGITVSNTDLSTVATNTTDISSDTSYMEDHLTFIKTDASSIATNTSNTAVNTSAISNCVWVAQNQLKVDLKTLNDTTVETNIGVVTGGVQRVCIADDDTNLSSIAGCVNMAGFLATDIATVNGTVVDTNAGNVGDGTQRVCIATDDVNIATINQSTSDLALSLNGSYQVGVNVKAINDNLISAGDGNNDTGTFRVSIARDDYNISQLINNSSGYLPAFNINLRGIHNGAEDKTIAVAAGNVSDGTPRICIATDDVNLASINAILTDVWDSTAHALRTV